MGKIIETKLVRWDGGMVNDPRDSRENTARVVTNFDILTDSYKMTPYRSSESGDSAPTTSKKKNFCVALRTGTTYSLYSLGVISGTAKAEVLFKDLTTGASNDLDDSGWATPSNNQSSAGTSATDLFVNYKLAGLIIGARAGTNLWAFSPTGSVWSDSWQALTYTNIAQGLVHSKDDILYIPYDNKIATYNHTGTAYNATALTLPSHLYITSICEDGNYLLIGCAPLSGVGYSVVYKWDRDSSLATLADSISWGEETLKILDKIDGIVVGISLSGGNSTRFSDRVICRYLSGDSAVKIPGLEFLGGTTTILPIAKQKINNRLYFMMQITLNGAVREGVWSIGRNNSNSPMTVIHERTPNNDTALTNGALYNFFSVGDYMFISYADNSSEALSKTDDTATYSATSIYESKIFNAGDSSLKKDLIGTTLMYEKLAAGASATVKYRVDGATSWTTIFTDAVDDSISHSAINIESTGATLPKDYKEIEFRLESINAKITAFSFMEEITAKRLYMALWEAIMSFGASLIRK